MSTPVSCSTFADLHQHVIPSAPDTVIIEGRHAHASRVPHAMSESRHPIMRGSTAGDASFQAPVLPTRTLGARCRDVPHSALDNTRWTDLAGILDVPIDALAIGALGRRRHRRTRSYRRSRQHRRRMHSRESPHRRRHLRTVPRPTRPVRCSVRLGLGCAHGGRSTPTWAPAGASERRSPNNGRALTACPTHRTPAMERLPSAGDCSIGIILCVGFIASRRPPADGAVRRVRWRCWRH